MKRFCEEHGVGENKTWGLLEILFGAKKPPKPTLSGLDGDTLLHYASSSPLGKSPNENFLHVDFDCKKLRNSYVIFQQPLFELKKIPIRPWKLCPHCADVTPMLFVHTKKHWWNAYDTHLTIMTEKEKERARRQRDS